MEILNNINRIVAYGCSYTAGDELLDHEILGMSFDDCNKFKRKYLNPLDFNKLTIGNQTIYDKIQADGRNRNVSWSGQLARLLGKEHKNNAVGGSSIDEQFYRIITDISNKSILETDLVLVGLTSPDRVFFFPPGSDKPISKMLHWQRAWSDHPDYHRAATEWFFTDFSIILNYYKNVKLLSTLQNKINIRLQPMRSTIIPTHTQFLYKSNIDKTNNIILDNFVMSVWDECQHLMLCPEEGITHNANQRCGFGHPTMEQHTQLVEKILAKLDL